MQTEDHGHQEPLPLGGAVQHSTDALCWWCRIDPVDGSLAALHHAEYRFLCKRCRQMLEIFSSYFARLQELTLPIARNELMRFIGLERVAMRLEMQEMKDRVDELLGRARAASAWVNNIPPTRVVEARRSHAPAVTLPVTRHTSSDLKKDAG